MIVIALLLATIGVADLARERFRGPRGIVTGGILGLAVAVLGTLGTGITWGWMLALAAALVAWQALTDYRAKPHVGYWPLALLAATVAAAWAFLRVDATPDSTLVSWYEALPYALPGTVTFDTFALGLGGVLVLFETANVIVRIVLPSEKKQAVVDAAPAAAPAARRRRWLLGRAQVGASATPAPVADAELAPLKGGRMIGPLERLFILALALAGQFTAIGAVIAAKGIIRFPEISKDDAGGSKAEYFLVGSFASWALVLAVAVLLQLGA
ncbi:hypothetical protein FB562_0729 [Homoserinimonas aerilata]|uniref:Uncharacterized protein n=1 Tax=Homoserinimonas aerilata TaxID=1162970 RepID=A0A542YHU1_9MICO|nr:hypothetical protein [Homoserinimonas aerilata]TQL47663.1 hypothetical protein FB562_0729 [Homoserinimonas aerilata]